MINGPRFLVNWLARHTPPCGEVTQLLSQSLEQPLSLRQRIGIRLHYLICIWCERYMRQLHLLRDAMHRHPHETDAAPSLSAKARARLKRSLADQTEK